MVAGILHHQQAISDDSLHIHVHHDRARKSSAKNPYVGRVLDLELLTCDVCQHCNYNKKEENLKAEDKQRNVEAILDLNRSKHQFLFRFVVKCSERLGVAVIKETERYLYTFHLLDQRALSFNLIDVLSHTFHVSLCQFVLQYLQIFLLESFWLNIT